MPPGHGTKGVNQTERCKRGDYGRDQIKHRGHRIDGVDRATIILSIEKCPSHARSHQVGNEYPAKSARRLHSWKVGPPSSVAPVSIPQRESDNDDDAGIERYQSCVQPFSRNQVSQCLALLLPAACIIRSKSANGVVDCLIVSRSRWLVSGTLP